MDIHYRIDRKDMKIWGSHTICTKEFCKMTSNRKEVTCKKCILHVEWDIRRYNNAEKVMIENE